VGARQNQRLWVNSSGFQGCKNWVHQESLLIVGDVEHVDVCTLKKRLLQHGFFTTVPEAAHLFYPCV
jgi:hypothetical protein